MKDIKGIEREGCRECRDDCEEFLQEATPSNVLTVVVCLVDTRRSILMRLVTRVCLGKVAFPCKILDRKSQELKSG